MTPRDQMSRRSRDAPSFLLERTWHHPDPPTIYASVLLRNIATGAHESIAVPRGPEHDPEKNWAQCQQAAVRYANALSAVASVWTPDPTPEELRDETRAILQQVSRVVIANIAAVAEWRFGQDSMPAHVTSDASPPGRRAAEVLRNRLGEDGSGRLLREVTRRAAVRIAHSILPVSGDEGSLSYEDFVPRFNQAWYERGARERQFVRDEFAHNLAQLMLEQQDPSSRSRPELLDLLSIWTEGRPIGGAPSALGLESVSIPVDEGVRWIARYLAGEYDPEPIDDGFLAFPDTRKRTYGQELQASVGESYVAEFVPPSAVPEALRRIRSDRNDTKAKVLIAACSYALSSRDSSPAGVTISVHEFVQLVSGYRRSGSRKTHSRYYWRKLAEVLRYLFLDLPSVQVNTQITRSYEAAATTVLARPLLLTPQLDAGQPFEYTELLHHLSNVSTSHPVTPRMEEAVAYLRSVQPSHLTIGFSEAIMDAFGRSTRAFEYVNRTVIQLTGPALWLALDVAFRRRWSDPSKLQPGRGIALIEALRETGFLDQSQRRTGTRVSYKSALRRFFDAVDALVALGELDSPGVRLWRSGSGALPSREMTSTIRAWVKSRAKRITQDALTPIVMHYVFSVDQLAPRQEARQRARRKRST